MRPFCLFVCLLWHCGAFAQTATVLQWQSLASNFAMISMVLLLNLVFFGVLFLLSARDIRNKKMAIEKHANDALVDPLTKVYNRRGFERRLTQQCAQTGYLLIIDIDNFKRINDNYGHPVGDLVLSEVAQILQQELREQDILSRFGGEEFVILSQLASYSDAQSLSQRLLQKIQQNTFTVQQQLNLAITVSIGASSVNLATKTFASFYQSADQNLYQAKNQGKNQAVIEFQ